MAWFKIAHNFRRLRPHEKILAHEVFHNTLPSLNSIGITDGLGKDSTIWTVDRKFFDFMQSGPPSSLDDLNFLLNFGEAVRWDLTDVRSLHIAVPGYPFRARDVFVHEMTHVWQFRRGFGVKADRIVAQNLGDGYEFPHGKEEPWISYNVEQQATIVEHWNRDRTGTGEDDPLFPYIHYIIRGEGDYQPKNFLLPNGVVANDLWLMDLPQLTVLWMMENMPVGKDPGLEPVRITQKDDSFLVILSGDVLFDFDKFGLRRGTDPILQRAAALIKSKMGPRFKNVLINGHTDSVGKDRHNQPLSESRARTVANWFTSRGYLPAASIVTQGFAATVPVATNANASGRAKNRRVEIYLQNN